MAWVAHLGPYLSLEARNTQLGVAVWKGIGRSRNKFEQCYQQCGPSLLSLQAQVLAIMSNYLGFNYLLDWVSSGHGEKRNIGVGSFGTVWVCL